MCLPYFGQDLDSKKKVVGILAHVWGEVANMIFPGHVNAGKIYP